MRKVLVVFLLLISIADSTYAVTESHKESARKFLRLYDLKGEIDKQLKPMVEAIERIDENTHGDCGASIIKKSLQERVKKIEENYDIIEQIFVDVHIDVFTEEELKELIVFYKTPLGQKVRSHFPEAIAKGKKMMEERLGTGDRVLERVREIWECKSGESVNTSYEEVAKEYLESTNYREDWEFFVQDDEYLDMVLEPYKEIGVCTSDKLKDELSVLWKESMDFDSYEKEYIQLLKKYYTKDDLKELIKFNKSPVGQKFINSTRDFEKDLVRLDNKFFEGFMARFQEIIFEHGACEPKGEEK